MSFIDFGDYCACLFSGDGERVYSSTVLLAKEVVGNAKISSRVGTGP